MAQTQLQQPDSSDHKTIRPIDFGSILDHLDNFGLTPVQFRVYCHLLTGVDSSGTISRSSESIAKVCKLTRITVLRVVAQLEKMSMIVCDRTAGKKTVYKLQLATQWQRSQPVENETLSNGSKVVSFPMSTTCKSDIPVNSIDSYQSEQVPLKGTCPTVAGVNLVSESNQLTVDTGNEPELTLDGKLDAVRQLGCNIGRVWRSGQMEILVDGLFMSVESFMQRSLLSFKENLQPCLAGLNLFREAIALIKQKIALAKRYRLAASLT